MAKLGQPVKDYVGATFGYLQVLRRDLSRKGKVFWMCRCTCGREISVVSGNLHRQKSCGCQNKRSIKHGGTRSRTYKVYQSMRYRCLNPTSAGYPNYGGRGITICKRWDSYENFLRDMGERPTGHSLDRIDNDRGYSPSNCRWATVEQQNRNKRDTKRITWEGRTQSLAEWARELGLKEGTLSARIYRYGMPLAKAMQAKKYRGD